MQRAAEDIMQELKIKRSMRRQLREMKSHIISEQSSSGGGFIESIKDVFRALKLAAMDISNAIRLAVGVFFTFNPEKIREKINEFDTRRQKINAQWKPLMDRADEAFRNADPILTMAVLGPANFLAMQGIGAGLETGKTAAEILTATDWEELRNSFSTPLSMNQGIQQFFQNYTRMQAAAQSAAVRNIASQPARGRGIMAGLSNVFSEGHETKGLTLNEQVINKKIPQQRFSEKQAIDIFIKSTGMDKSFESIRTQNIENLSDTINSVLEQIQPMRSSAQLFAANDMLSFERAFQSAKAANPKLDDSILTKFKKAVLDETENLSNNAQFIDQVKKASGGAQVTPDKIRSEAQMQVFEAAKQELDKSLFDGLSKTVTATDEAIKKLSIDDKVLDALKKSPYDDAKQLAKVYENLLNVYKEIKNDFDTKAKLRKV
jgi:hypothetical protein